MRLKVELMPFGNTFAIPINYNYPLAGAIYKLLMYGSKEFSEWLHDSGYISKDGKPFKLFNFSKIYFEQITLQNNIGVGNGKCSFFVSSPIINTHIHSLIKGIMEQPKLELGNNEVVGRFKIKKVSIVREPEFFKKMNYKMLSPTVVQTMSLTDKGLKVYYLRANDGKTINSLIENLKRKFELIHNYPYIQRMKINFDEEYIKEKGGYGKISKLITIKEGRPDETKVKAFICPFTLDAEPIIHKLAYDCGIGNKNSIGFGMIDCYDKD